MPVTKCIFPHCLRNQSTAPSTCSEALTITQTKPTLLGFCHLPLDSDTALPRFLNLSARGSENSLVQLLDLISLSLVVSYSTSSVPHPWISLERVDLDMTHTVPVSSHLLQSRCRPISVRASLSTRSNLTHRSQDNSSHGLWVTWSPK